MPVERDETDESQATSNLAWFLTGALIGATAALLYAPKSGKETRQYIADRTQQGREAVESTTEDLVGAGKEMFERGRKLVEDAADLFDRGRKLVKG
jgi:gas vesicle protein